MQADSVYMLFGDHSTFVIDVSNYSVRVARLGQHVYHKQRYCDLLLRYDSQLIN